MATSKIEWTDAVWNPVTGCTPVSSGCDHCYARKLAQRLAGRCGYPKDEPFRVTFHEDKLELPLRWRKPRRIFVNSMGDLFHDDVPFGTLAKLWRIMAMADQHTFLILTKRAARMAEWAAKTNPLPNVWLGVSAENQDAWNARRPYLGQLAMAGWRTLVSLEPLLSTIDLQLPTPCDRNCNEYQNAECPGTSGLCCMQYGPNWIIVGGENGPGARPCHPAWVRSIRDQCQAAGVSFWFKGWGEWQPAATGCGMTQDVWNHAKRHLWLRPDGQHIASDREEGTREPMARVGKKRSGRLLDGREWQEVPTR